MITEETRNSKSKSSGEMQQRQDLPDESAPPSKCSKIDCGDQDQIFGEAIPEVDNAVAVLQSLSNDIASKEKNLLGYKVLRTGDDSFTAKCKTCETTVALGAFPRKVSNLDLHCSSTCHLVNLESSSQESTNVSLLTKMLEEKYPKAFKHSQETVTCILCQKSFSASKGVVSKIFGNIAQHVKSNKHLENAKAKQGSRTLSSFFKPRSSTDEMQNGKDAARSPVSL